MVWARVRAWVRVRLGFWTRAWARVREGYGLRLGPGLGPGWDYGQGRILGRAWARVREGSGLRLEPRLLRLELESWQGSGQELGLGLGAWVRARLGLWSGKGSG